MTLLWRGTGSVLVACLAAAGAAAHAQNYPQKPVRMIVGPGSDFVVRLVGRKLFITLSLVLSVHPSVPAQSVQDLIKLARARPK